MTPLPSSGDVRRSASPLAALALVLAACGGERSEEGAAPAGPPPDVVIFLVDTLRADWLGAYDPARATSPAIDALAREGVVFEQASAPAPWTLPSVVSLFTSTFVAEHDVIRDGDVLSTSLTTLAEHSSRLGYVALSFHRNPYAGAMAGLERGFGRCELTHNEMDGARLRPWLDSVPDRPLFLYLHNTQPHDPHKAPKELVERFGTVPEDALGEIVAASEAHRALTRVDFVQGSPLGTTDNSAQQDAQMRRLAERASEVRTLYSAAVMEADRCVGEVIAELRRAGRFERTLFVLLADHGEEMGEHGGWQHDQSLYEELVHVPLVVRFPGGRYAGRRIREPVSLVDVLPTVLDVLGRPELARGARGRSLLALLDETASERGPRITAMRWNEKKHYRPWAERRGERNVAVRDGSFKAIWNADLATLELYDLARDPGEQDELSAREPERARALAELARSAFEEQLAMRVTAGERAPGELEPAARRALQDLGYVGEDEGEDKR